MFIIVNLDSYSSMGFISIANDMDTEQALTFATKEDANAYAEDGNFERYKIVEI